MVDECQRSRGWMMKRIAVTMTGILGSREDERVFSVDERY